MDKQNTIRQIWRECFPNDTEAWVDMYFNRAYADEYAITLDVNNETVSSLLLQPYAMTFHGHTVAVAYISGAATRRTARGRGYMKMLIAKAIQQSYDRGDMLCTLIPAAPWLVDYYGKMGFSSVFYRRIEHYTSVHIFPDADNYKITDTVDLHSLYDAFCRLISQRDSYICHTYDQFVTVMEDNQLSDGIFKAVQNDAGTIVGMAWAVPQSDSDGIRVIEILYDTQLTHDILLHLLQNDAHGRPLTVCRQPSDNSDMKLQSYGMARLVNVESALSVIASEYPALRIAIRVSDPIIARNNNTYLLADGIVTVTNRIPDLDLNINVLTSIIFSPSHIGNIIGLPTVRPSMTLMLD